MFTGPNIPKDGLEFMIDPANEKSTGGFLRDQNMLDYSTWQLNGTSATGFSRNGGESENAIISGTGPFGETTLVWETRCDSSLNADGGWNGSYYSVDSTKTYRLSVWVKKTSSSSSGTFYLGTNGGGACVQKLSDFTSQCNPYWECRGVSGYTQNVWYLVVGHVFPYTYNSSTGHPDSGRYTIADGRVSSNNGCNVGNDMRMAQGTTSLRHRTYHYYSSDDTVRLQFAYPRMDLVDGTEPSVQDLLDGKSRTLTNLANPSNTVFQVNNLKIRTSDYFNHRRNRVLDFDGTDDLITTSFGSGRNVATNPFTVVAWVKSDSTNTNQMWVDVGGNGSNQRFYSTLINGSSRNFGIQATGWSDSQPDDTNWHHQAIVMDGSTARGYNNGVQVQTLGYTSYTLPGTITFGGRSGYYWNGQIAKTKIYNRALSASEVLRDYNATKGRFL
jgi:hypothetical protein